MHSRAHLVLVGPTGSGKSALGRLLAERCGLGFVDLDRAIEVRLGCSLPELFERVGEAGFREHEARELAHQLSAPQAVIATGAGVVLRESNRECLRRSGFVLHLALDVEGQLQRLAADRSRPLLQVSDRAAVLREMAATRDPLYAALADLRLDTRGLRPAQACERLMSLLQPHWQADPPG